MDKNAEIKSNKIGTMPSIKWQGRSGRFYPLVQEKLDDFVLSDDDLYVIAEGNNPRWIGTADDLIIDGNSRAKFRAAVKVASSILRVSSEKSESERMRVAWDIEGGHLANGANFNSSNMAHAHWL